MADPHPNRTARVLARLRRDLTLGLVMALLGVLAVAAVAVTLPSAAGSAPRGARSAVTPTEHGAVVAAAPVRPRADATTGLVLAFAVAVTGERWLAMSTGRSRRSRHDARTRWRARMVGAPPSSS